MAHRSRRPLAPGPIRPAAIARSFKTSSCVRRRNLTYAPAVPGLPLTSPAGAAAHPVRCPRSRTEIFYAPLRRNRTMHCGVLATIPFHMMTLTPARPPELPVSIGDSAAPCRPTDPSQGRRRSPTCGTELDARGRRPPDPLVVIRAAVAELGPDEILQVRTREEPIALVLALASPDIDVSAGPLPDDTWRITLRLR